MPDSERRVRGTSIARTHALVRMWDELAAASDPDRVAQVAAEVLHRELGGGVAVLLSDADDPGRLRLATVRHDVPEVGDELRRVLGFTTTSMDEQGYLAQAVRRGGPLVVDDPWGMADAQLPDYLPWLRQHPVTSLLVVPLVLDERLLGFVLAGRHEPGGTYDPGEVSFAEDAAGRVGVAMANAYLAAIERARVRRERAVAEVSRLCDEALNRSDDVLRVAATAIGRQLRAGGCAIWLVDDAGAEHLGRGTYFHPDPQVTALIREHLPRIVDVVRGFVAGVRERGRGHLAPGDPLLQQLAELPELAPVAGRFGSASVYARRVDARGVAVAVVAVSREDGELPPDDVRLVDAAGDRVALALDNAALLAFARTTQQRQRALVQHSSDMLVLADRDGTIRYASPSAARVFGGSLAESFLANVVEEERELARRAWRAVVRTPGVGPPVEFRFRDTAGRERRLLALANNLLDDPAVEGVVLTVRDVTGEREAAERLEERSAQQAALAAIAAAALSEPAEELPGFVARCIGETLSLPNVGVLRLTAGRTWRILGSNSPGFGPGYEIPTLPGSGLERVLATREPLVVDDYRRTDVVDEPHVVAQYDTVSGAIAPITVAGQVWGCLGAYSREHRRFSPVEVDFLQTAAALVASAVERSTITERMLHQARHDALTSLPNRGQLREHLERTLSDTGTDASVSLLLLDLDDFKDVNDALGHQVGDTALAQLGNRLCALVSDGDLVARLGGDEFAICLAPARNEMRALEVAAAVLAALREPFELPGIDVLMSGSIGIAVAPAHGREPDALMQAADMAMYRAKGDRTGWALYDPAVDGQRAERLAVLAHLRTGLARGDLELHYQPLVDLRSEQVVAVEALVRWHHPDRGLLLPASFVPFAEQTELVHDLTRYTVVRATQQAREWRAAGWAGTVAVNVSPAALRRPALVRELQDVLTDADGAVTVEITESALVDERARTAVHVLARAGVGCSVDDFGTGYSSLTYLRTLPVTRLKLDRAFNRRVDRDERDAAIVGGVVGLAHSIGLDVVAEGVETTAVSRRLSALEVDVAQGWLYGRAAPAKSLRLVS